MATGVLLFEGMKVGVLPGDFAIQVDENGSIDAKLVLSTAYNVLPVWIRVAHDQLWEAKRASDSIRDAWSADDNVNRELLISELEPSMQVFVACGIALDSLYDQLRPFAKISHDELESWRNNKTSRATQIVEVVRRVYRLDAEVTAKFKQNISGVIKYRDLAVHPSLELRQSCTRPDLRVGVDWKFSAYRYSNAVSCFKTTMELLIYLYERKCQVPEVVAEMERIFAALEQLKVVTRNIPLEKHEP
jgi:hypothetical protein